MRPFESVAAAQQWMRWNALGPVSVIIYKQSGGWTEPPSSLLSICGPGKSAKEWARVCRVVEEERARR